MADADQYRRESRARWGASAAGWEARRDAMRQATMPVSAWMVDAIDPQPGQTVLELAAGPGDTGFLAAELIQPGGTLITSDFAPEMLTVAQRRAQELGIPNVRFKQIDAESIDLEAGTIDGVLCRWGFMLMADPEAALRETRRVLRPNRRLALAAWTGPEDNPWTVVGARAMVERGLMEPPDPQAPGQFAWAREGVIAELLQAAGFTAHDVRPLDFTLEFASFDEWWSTNLDLSNFFADAARAADPAVLEEVRADVQREAQRFARDDGRVVVPARTWVAWATP
jgi:SAM-dependent methyltransferase